MRITGKNIVANFILLILVVVANLGCKKIIGVDAPRTEVLNTSVFSSDESAISAARGIYSLMMSNTGFMNSATEEFTGLSADELINYSSDLDQVGFYNNELLTTNSVVYNNFWRAAYSYIANANALLENLQVSTSVSDSVRKQLQGEAKLVRAYCHFYLVNFFGKIPYVTTTDYRVNMSVSREEISAVYDKIIEDLISAKESLASDYSYSAGERAEPNKWAAIAMLARVYLYLGNWEKAEEEATSVIESGLFDLVDVNSVYLANSGEAIWQLQPVLPGLNTSQASQFIMIVSPTNGGKDVALSDELLQVFEEGDKRRSNWIGSITDGNTYFYSYKYKVTATPVVEYATVLRVAEQYLIRAEARIQLDRTSEGIDDLNALRDRARDQASIAVPDPLPALPGSLSKTDALAAVMHERQVELFTEGGHRWLDLKRTKTADEVLSVIKGASWQPADTLYPIPQNERLANPNLSQNSGY